MGIAKWIIRLSILILIGIPFIFLLEYYLNNTNLAALITLIIIMFLYWSIEDFFNIKK
jgi:hypothetical protein